MNDNTKYSKIIGMSRPVSKTRRPMSMSDRAAQFSAFAALTGYGDEIKEKARYTDSECQITEDMAYNINEKLIIISENIKCRPSVNITRFIKDPLKSGGKYIDCTVTVRRIDEIKRMIITAENEKIPIDGIVSITGEIFKNAGR